jgi:tetratricopeptide (TPR) repeat protein
MVRPRLRTSRVKPLTLVVLPVLTGVLVAGGFYAHAQYTLRRALADARFFIAAGQPERAGIRLEPVFDEILVRVGASPEHCRLLFDAYLPARNALRLERIAQRCDGAGERSPEEALGIAEGYDRMGRSQDAIEAYRQAARAHPKALALHDISRERQAQKVVRRKRKIHSAANELELC